jgi:hypothetical protein
VLLPQLDAGLTIAKMSKTISSDHFYVLATGAAGADAAHLLEMIIFDRNY